MTVQVSVIVPVYKTEAYLEKCLDSLVGQTLKDIEILVVNDGSPDQSQDIIDQYAQKYPSVIGLHKENGGLSDARNFGIQKAKGMFVAFVDSDDYVTNDMMETMYRQATRENLDVVICDTFMDYPQHSYVLKADLGYTSDPLKASIFAYPNAPARMVRKELLQAHLFRKDIWYEDLDLMPTLAAYTDKIGFCHKPLYHYVQREDSIMNQKEFRDKFYDIFTVLEDVWQVYAEKQLTQKYFSELEYLYISQLQRSTLLRFVGLKGSKEAIKKIHLLMNERFPQWVKNPYFKKSSWKFQMICQLGRFHQYWAIKILKKI